MRAGRGALFVAVAIAATGCSAIVASKLGDVPDRDGGLPSTCTTPADCDDGNMCNGVETCTGMRCQLGMALRDGEECDTMPRSICLTAVCGVSRCGDRFIDTMQDPPEVCDDANMVPDDGCTNECQFSCTMQAECDNGFACDGLEPCTADHRCGVGTLPPPSAPCMRPSSSTPIDMCEIGDGGELLCCSTSECCDVNGNCMPR